MARHRPGYGTLRGGLLAALLAMAVACGSAGPTPDSGGWDGGRGGDAVSPVDGAGRDAETGGRDGDGYGDVERDSIDARDIPFLSCDDFWVGLSVVGYDRYEQDSVLLPDGHLTCRYIPGGNGQNYPLRSVGHTWAASEQELVMLRDGLAQLDWAGIEPPAHVHDQPYETIDVRCAGQQLLVSHQPSTASFGRVNRELHDLVRGVLWPDDCWPQPLSSLRQAEVAPGWEAEVFEGVPGNRVTPCGDRLAIDDDVGNIRLVPPTLDAFVVLPHVSSMIGEQYANYLIVLHVACAEGFIYAHVGRKDISGVDPRAHYVLRLEPSGLGHGVETSPWMDVTADLASLDLITAARGTGAQAVVTGSAGIVWTEGGDFSPVSSEGTPRVELPHNPASPDLWAFWADDGRTAAFALERDGDNWSARNTGASWGADQAPMESQAVASRLLVLGRDGSACLLSQTGDCTAVAKPDVVHQWAAASDTAADFAVVTDWRLIRAEGGGLAEHAVHYYVVGANRPPELLLSTDDMAYPPGIFVSGDGIVYLPTGDAVLRLTRR